MMSLRHEEVKYAEGDGSDGGQEKKTGVVTEVIDNGTGNDLTERSSKADRRKDVACRVEGLIAALAKVKELAPDDSD